MTETFSITLCGDLLRSVVPNRGAPYEHTCRRETFEAVAWAIDQRGGLPFTNEVIRDTVDLPFTQVMVAMAFLKERGCITSERRRAHVAASGVFYEDAMIEWHALREGAPGAA